MSFLAIDLISPSIEKTKKFLFPIKKKLWLKLGLVTLLAGSGGSGGGNSFRIPSGTDFTTIQQFLSNYWMWIIIGIGMLVILTIIGLLVQAIFNFILLDSVEKKQCLIGKSFKKTGKKAITYFGLELLIGIIFFAIIGGLLYPIVAFRPQPIFYFIAIPIFLLIILGITIIGFIINSLVMPEIYYHKVKAIISLKRMMKLTNRKKGQVGMYLLMTIVLRIAGALIALVIMLIMLLLFAIMAGIIFLIGYLLTSIPGALTVLIIIGIILAVILFLLFIYSIAVILVPIEVFFVNYKLDFYKKIMKKS